MPPQTFSVTDSWPSAPHLLLEREHRAPAVALAALVRVDGDVVEPQIAAAPSEEDRPDAASVLLDGPDPDVRRREAGGEDRPDVAVDLDARVVSGHAGELDEPALVLRAMGGIPRVVLVVAERAERDHGPERNGAAAAILRGVRIYGDLAPWFHLLTAPADYAGEAARYRGLILDELPEARTLLELGSGGGNNASHLKAALHVHAGRSLAADAHALAAS